MLSQRHIYPHNVVFVSWTVWLIRCLGIAIPGTAALLLSTNSHSITVSRFQQDSGGAWSLTGTREADLKVALPLITTFWSQITAQMFTECVKMSRQA